jgi:hypothetical protein
MYRCKLCGAKVKEIPDKCPCCGGSGDSIWEELPKPLLVLVGEGGNEFIIFEDEKVFKQSSFKMFPIDVYQYINRTKQFIIFFDEEKKRWIIKGENSAVNPTLVNDFDVSGKERELKTGDIIKVGPLELNVKIK